MDELSSRRKKLFAGAPFRSALFYSGDDSGNPNANFRYFSGCGIDGTYLLLRQNSGMLLAHEMNYRAARETSRYPAKLLGKDRARDIRLSCGSGKIGLALGELSASRFFALKNRAKLRACAADGKAYEVRGRKSPSELRALSASAAIARKILDSLDVWGCKTEVELATRLKIAALEAGAEISFPPIVATERNSSKPHHEPTAKKLEGAVLVDFGVRHKGYCSDFTRCYFKGKCREMAAYEKCSDIFAEILDALPECEKGRDVSLLSQKLLASRGLPALVHAIGHGIGLEVHEYPHLGAKSGDSLAGAALALEPAAYFSNYGVRFEEMVVNANGRWRKA